MGQYAVILTISAILLGGVLLYNARASTRDANDELSAYQTDRIAREASQIALRDVVGRLNAKPDAWTNTLSVARDTFNIPTTTYEMGGGIATTYAVNLTEMYLGTPSNPADPDRVRLEVNGTFDNWNETTQSVEPTNYIVEAVYERGWVEVHVPGGFRKAVWSNSDIDVGGTAWVAGDVHANRNLSSSSSSFEVYGTGTYTGSESAQDNRFIGTPSLAERDSIVAPIVTFPPGSPHSTQPAPPGPPSWTLSAANDPTATPGDSLVHGWLEDSFGNPVIGKGTAEAPYILHVDGNLSIINRVRLLGHIRIYVSGNLTVSNDAGLSSARIGLPGLSDDPDEIEEDWVNVHIPDGVPIGLYVTGNVSLGERSFLSAMLYTYGTVTSVGSGSEPRLIVGGIVSHQPVSIGGNAKVFYKEGADSVYDPDIPNRVPEGIRLVSYREWAERP